MTIDPKVLELKEPPFRHDPERDCVISSKCVWMSVRPPQGRMGATWMGSCFYSDSQMPPAICHNCHRHTREATNEEAEILFKLRRGWNEWAQYAAGLKQSLLASARETERMRAVVEAGRECRDACAAVFRFVATLGVGVEAMDYLMSQGIKDGFGARFDAALAALEAP